MKIFVRSVLVATALLFITSIANAQTPEGNATVFIYKTDHRDTIKRVKVPIMLDGREIASLERNRYLIAKIPAGRHVLTSKHEKSVALTIDLNAGETYYVRVSTDGGMIKITPPEFALVTVWEGRAYVGDMKQIEQKDIIDEAIVQKSDRKVPEKAIQKD